ncbi:exo-alpha-sialidase [Sphingobacterium suaedae]|uniref:Exo-alpha-sialidase n=1 Tax=Sphingobacterium suaedae TaxID=1686402 RepID=A0ABW5KL85_9SPHI
MKRSLIKVMLFILPVLLGGLQSCTTEKTSKEADMPVSISDSTNKASCVFLTDDENNHPVISWIELDSAGNKSFYLSYWDEAAQAFSPSTLIPIESHASLHEEGMPKIAVKANGTVIATYETSVPSKTSKYGLSDIRYVMSVDRGKTWSKPQSVQPDYPNRGSRSFSNTIRLDNGEVGIVWLDTDTISPGNGRPVRFAKTAGTSFGASVLIDSAACECCRTALSSDRKGRVQIVFRDLLAGSVRDIAISQSQDNGQTFGPAVAFSGDHWAIAGCPHNGPSIVGKNGRTYVTWFTGAEQQGVFYGEIDSDATLLQKHRLDANARFAQLCLTPDGAPVMAYNVNYTTNGQTRSKIKVARMQDKQFVEKEINSPHAKASYPVLRALGKSHVLIAWTDSGQVYYVRQAIAAIDTPAGHTYTAHRQHQDAAKGMSEQDTSCPMHPH